MQTAATEAAVKLGSSDIAVSVDGNWQRRGYSSKNGVVTTLSVLGRNEGSSSSSRLRNCNYILSNVYPTNE